MAAPAAAADAADGHAVAVHRVLEAALGDHWNNVPLSYAEFLDQNVHQDDFDPGLWFIATDDEQTVGAALGSAHGDRGAVDLVGVARSHRGRGIASALLGMAFDEFRQRGLARAAVGRFRPPDRCRPALRTDGDARPSRIQPCGAGR